MQILISESNFDQGTWIGHPEDSEDNVVKRAKGNFADLVKNTYRVLLSRAHKGCYVCFLDKETEKFFRSRMEAGARTDRDSEHEAALRRKTDLPYTLFVDALPLVDFEAAGKGKEAASVKEIVRVPQGEYGNSHFLFRVNGTEMEPVIPGGSLCLFKKSGGENIEGRIVLLKIGGTSNRLSVARIRKRAFLDVREGARSERMLWTAEFADSYVQPILFGDVNDIEILGLFEKVIPS
jgi:hypothetical protein